MTLFGDSPRHDAYVALALVATVISSLADIFLLFLIRKMQLWNGHILLILTMSLFQLMYDVSFFPAVITTTDNNALQLSVEIFQFTGGITSSVFSNCIAFITLYVVYFKSSIDIFQYYRHMLVVALLPCAIISLVYLLISISEDQSLFGDLQSIDMAYCYVRVGSICLNFFMSTYTLKLIRDMASGSSVKSHSEKVINVLARRLLYYPVVQALGRSAITVYEVIYGFHFDPAHPRLGRYIAQIIMVCTAPLISVGYLAIFLIMQPHAMRVAAEMLRVNKINDSSNSDDVDEFMDGRYEQAIRKGINTGGEDKASLLESSYFSESSHSQIEHLGMPFKDEDLSVNSHQQLRASLARSNNTEQPFNFHYNPLVYDNVVGLDNDHETENVDTDDETENLPRNRSRDGLAVSDNSVFSVGRK